MTTRNQRGNNRSGSSWGEVAKWIVLGVIILAVLLIFRGELSRILDRATGIKISRTGIEIKTVKTALGKTKVSNVSLNLNSNLLKGINETYYVSKRYNFMIGWQRIWNGNESVGKLLQQKLSVFPNLRVPLVINKKIGNYNPNVIVGIHLDVGNLSVKEFMDKNAQNIIQQGSNILSKNIDEETQGGLLVYLSYFSGYESYNLQRYLIKDRRGYIVTASGLPPKNRITQQLREELLNIINSFQLIE